MLQVNRIWVMGNFDGGELSRPGDWFTRNASAIRAHLVCAVDELVSSASTAFFFILRSSRKREVCDVLAPQEQRLANRPAELALPKENDLVRRIQSELPYGTAAFRELIETYTPRIRRRALRLVGNASDADEIVQDVFLRVFRSIRRFSLDRPLQHWLYTITSNSSKNLLRSRYRDNRRTSEFIEDRKIQGQADRGADGPLGDSLNSALDSLDPATREAIILRFAEEYSFPEIAHQMNLGESAIKMRVRRGLEKLKRTLNQSDSE